VSTWARLRNKLRFLSRRNRFEREMEEEIDFHRAMIQAEETRLGFPLDEASARARRKLGNVTTARGACREAWTIAWLDTLAKDLRLSLRLWIRQPGFALVAIVTLALGVGASTAIFSVVYGVLLKPLPFRDADRLVSLWTSVPKSGVDRVSVGAANWRDWREQNTTFTDISIVGPAQNFNITGGDEPERVQAARLRSNMLAMLGVTPAIGRGFMPEEDLPGKDRVTLLSHELWKRQFGGATDIVGHTIYLSGVPYTIVGVMDRNFIWPGREFQLWIPTTINPDDFIRRPRSGFLAYGRLKPGVTIEQAQQNLDAISARLAQQYPSTNDGLFARVSPLLSDTIRDVSGPLYMLLGAVGALLAIGCVNMVNLLIARALVRRREIVVRMALGASRSRLMTHSLIELLPLLASGGAGGMMAAYWCIQSVAPLLPADLPRGENIGLNLPVLGFAVAVLFAIGIGVAIWPALDVWHTPLRVPTAERPARTRVRDLLVTAQIAITLLLLVGAVLLMRSFLTVKEIDVGFNRERVLTAHMAIPRSKYANDRVVSEYCRRLLERLRLVPGLESVAMVNRLPLSGLSLTSAIEFEGADPAVGVNRDVEIRSASPEYFRTMQIPLLDGRSFSDQDTFNTPNVGIIDRQLADRVWPGMNPIGRRFRFAGGQSPGEWHSVVGVVGHIRHDRIEEDRRSQVYFSYQQMADGRPVLVAKTAGTPESLIRPVVAAVHEVDPEQPLYDVRSLSTVIDRSLSGRWIQTLLLAVFAAIALLLASIGVYGVIAYAVGQRLREFGVRIALGARPQDLALLVLAKGAGLIGIGAVGGLLAAIFAVRVLSKQVYGMKPLDLVSFAEATASLVLVALIACIVPAWRATRVNPTTVLRCE
jgi:putative ABC transport system permease protein